MPDDSDFTMTEELSFMDMLQPWPHHFHLLHEDTGPFAACDCGWVGDVVRSHRTAALAYQAHIERNG